MTAAPPVVLLRKIRLAVFDFDGVFTDNRVIVSEDGEESVICNRSDGLGLRRLESVKVRTLILSTEVNPLVIHRARKLKIRCIHGLEDKAKTLHEEVKRMGIPLEQVAFIGNDINDIGCLQAAGLPVVVADAWPEVRPLARWILSRRGGDGAVREFCDTVWRAKSGAPRNGKRETHG